MSTVHDEITALEDRLRIAELGPDPSFFEEALADDAIMVTQDGQATFAKTQIVAAHQPGDAPKFTRVEMSDLVIIEHDTAAVVTCRGTFEGPAGTAALNFMRVWLKKNGRWQIIAGSVSN